MTWAEAFGLTLVVEVPLYVVLLRSAAGTRLAVAAGSAVAINAVSHPLLWFVLQPVLAPALPVPLGLLAAEAAVVVGEAAALALTLRRGWSLAVAAALVVNGASLAIGLLAQR